MRPSQKEKDKKESKGERADLVTKAREEGRLHSQSGLLTSSHIHVSIQSREQNRSNKPLEPTVGPHTWEGAEVGGSGVHKDTIARCKYHSTP